MTNRQTAQEVMALLRGSAVGDTAVLVGSSALFGIDTAVQPFTEDIDVCVPEAVVVERGDQIAAHATRCGFRHERGTATFLRADGASFDLLGHGDAGAGDHIAGHGTLRVMVFEDLSWILTKPAARMTWTEGARCLSPAGFVVTKILTERSHKGAKDKFQALLLAAEQEGDQAFLQACRSLLARVEPIRRDDARASCEEALLSLAGDPLFRDAGAERYASAWRDAQAGFGVLTRILDALQGRADG